MQVAYNAYGCQGSLSTIDTHLLPDGLHCKSTTLVSLSVVAISMQCYPPHCESVNIHHFLKDEQGQHCPRTPYFAF